MLTAISWGLFAAAVILAVVAVTVERRRSRAFRHRIAELQRVEVPE